MTEMDKLIALMEKEAKRQSYIAYASLAVGLLAMWFTYKQYKER